MDDQQNKPPEHVEQSYVEAARIVTRSASTEIGRSGLPVWEITVPNAIHTWVSIEQIAEAERLSFNEKESLRKRLETWRGSIDHAPHWRMLDRGMAGELPRESKYLYRLSEVAALIVRE